MQRSMTNTRVFAAAAILALSFLPACGGGSTALPLRPAATPTSTATLTPAATTSPTATTAPMATPTASAAPKATITPTPTPSASPTSSPRADHAGIRNAVAHAGSAADTEPDDAAFALAISDTAVDDRSGACDDGLRRSRVPAAIYGKRIRLYGSVCRYIERLHLDRNVLSCERIGGSVYLHRHERSRPGRVTLRSPTHTIKPQPKLITVTTTGGSIDARKR